MYPTVISGSIFLEHTQRLLRCSVSVSFQLAIGRLERLVRLSDLFEVLQAMPLSRASALIKVVTALCFGTAWECFSIWSFLQGIVPSITDVVAMLVSPEIADPSFYGISAIRCSNRSLGSLWLCNRDNGRYCAWAKSLRTGVFEPYINAIGGTPKIIFSANTFSDFWSWD